MLRLLAQREQGYDDIAALTGSSVAEVRAKVREALTGLDQGMSQDQRAMLRLLARREEGYDDIAALTGSSVEEVRAKVRVALAGLDAEPPATVEKKKTEQPTVEPTSPTPAPKPAKSPAGPVRRKAAPGGLRLPEDRGLRRALAAGGAVVL